MKSLFKSVLSAVGVAAAATVAQANVETETLTAAHPPAPAGDTILVTSTVTPGTGIYAGDYLYNYTLTKPNGSTLIAGVDAFTVYDPGIANLASLIVPGSIYETLSFGHGTITLNHIEWTSGRKGDQPLPLDFGFYSPDAPIQGFTGAQDDYIYGATSGSVYVPDPPTNNSWPKVPDGGLTLTLLGGTMLGLGGLRRKLGC
jgi:hypothetical protein